MGSMLDSIEKQNYYRRENIIPDPRKWWANGNIICNEHCRYRNKADETQYWGDQFLAQLRDMYALLVHTTSYKSLGHDAMETVGWKMRASTEIFQIASSSSTSEIIRI